MKGLRLRVLTVATAFVLASGALASPFGAAVVQAEGFSISGRVAGSAGNLGGISISGCTTNWSFCSDPVQTDDSGYFSLVGLVSGHYILDVQTGPSYHSGSYQAPGLTQDVFSATPVDVTGGSVVLPDIQLSVAYSISGVVTGSAGMLGELGVLSCTVDPGICDFGAIDEGGNYVVSGLSPGTYQLMFANSGTTPYVSGLYSASGLTHQFSDRAEIVITDSSVVLPTFDIPLGVTITGTVTGAVGQLGDISVSAMEDTWDTAAYGGALTDAEGNFTIMGLWPGSYRIMFEEWTETYVSGTWTPNGLVQGDGPHTAVGPEGLDLGVVQMEIASTISGTVTGDAGPVAIDPIACRSDGYCHSGYSDESGNFSVRGLAAGSYVLQFNDWSGTYAGGYYSDSGVVANASQATPLAVPPSVSGLTATLPRPAAVRTPGAPTNVYAIPAVDRVDVHWTPPLDDGGSPILEYTIATTDGTGATIGTYTNEAPVWNLTYGETYSFTVVARNAAGYGDISAPSDPVTLPMLPPIPAAVRLAATATPQTITAGGATTVTISALDQDGNVVPDYAGTVSLSSSDPRSGLPEPYTYTPQDAGVHQFTVSLRTAGSQLISASDGSLEQGEVVVTVTAGPAALFVVAGPQDTTAGVVQRYSVTATDAYGNVTDYSGAARVKSTDPKLAAPAYVRLVNGHGTIKATFTTAGTQRLGLSDAVTGAVGEIFVRVRPGSGGPVGHERRAAPIRGARSIGPHSHCGRSIRECSHRLHR